MTLNLVAYVLGGSVLGFAYQYFVGCRTGTCPLTSNPYIATGYGAFLGLMASGAMR